MNKGFTLIEILVTTFIAIILATIGLSNLVGFNTQKKLDNNAQAIVALLRSAQEKSINQEDSVRWGVSFYNSSSAKDNLTLFQVDETLIASSSYTGIPGTSTDQVALNGALEMSDPSEGNRINIAFNKFTGNVDANESVVIHLKSSTSSLRTITVNTNGRIDSE